MNISFENSVAVPIIFPDAELIVAATIDDNTNPDTIGGANVNVASANALDEIPLSAYPSIHAYAIKPIVAGTIAYIDDITPAIIDPTFAVFPSLADEYVCTISCPAGKVIQYIAIYPIIVGIPILLILSRSKPSVELFEI